MPSEAVALIVVTSVLVGGSILLLSVKRDASLTFVQENSETLKIGLAVAAGLYTAWIYYVEMRDQRIANALSYQENASTPYMQRAFERLDMLWIRGAGYEPLKEHIHARETINKKYKNMIDSRGIWNLENSKNKELSDINRKLARKAAELVRSKRLEDEVFKIYYYYYDIVTCVNRGRCHKKTACEIFASDIEKFRLDYRNFLHEWDELWNVKITRGLRNFYFDCANKKRGEEMPIGAYRRGRLGVQDTRG